MSRDPLGPKAELRERIMAALIPVLRRGPAQADDYADAVMKLFYSVEDEWHRIEVTALGQAGESFIDNRFIVARVPVQAVNYERLVDRNVAP